MADFKFIVTSEEDGMEMRQLMRKHFDFSARLRNKVKREKLLLRNGIPAEGFHRAKAGDVVSVKLPEERSHFTPENIPLDIVYEDDDLLLVNKQPHLVVHPTKGVASGTLANALMYHMEETGRHFKIRFVNRLDMDTSGLLVVAKNSYAQSDYIRQTDRQLVIKEYLAIVEGVPTEDRGVIDLPIGHPDENDLHRRVCPDGAPSLTHYETIARYPAVNLSLLRLRLETGRTHQIRVHLSHIGHPVLSDHLYGTERPDLIGRQALHAAHLRFYHPTTKRELHFEAPLPSDMQSLLDQLRD